MGENERVWVSGTLKILSRTWLSSCLSGWHGWLACGCGAQRGGGWCGMSGGDGWGWSTWLTHPHSRGWGWGWGIGGHDGFQPDVDEWSECDEGDMSRHLRESLTLWLLHAEKKHFHFLLTKKKEKKGTENTFFLQALREWVTGDSNTETCRYIFSHYEKK